MVNFFKKGFSIMTTGLRWIVGAILGAGGFATFFAAGFVGSPFNKIRKWAAKRTWTKPINWLFAPVEWACDMVAFLGICSGLAGGAAFWPEIKGSETGDEIVRFFGLLKAKFKNGVNNGIAGEQGVAA